MFWLITTPPPPAPCESALFIILPELLGTNISAPRSPTNVGCPACTVPPPANLGVNVANSPVVPPKPKTEFRILLTIAICINVLIICFTISLAKLAKPANAPFPSIRPVTNLSVKAAVVLVIESAMLSNTPVMVFISADVASSGFVKVVLPALPVSPSFLESLRPSGAGLKRLPVASLV